MCQRVSDPSLGHFGYPLPSTFSSVTKVLLRIQQHLLKHYFYIIVTYLSTAIYVRVNLTKCAVEVKAYHHALTQNADDNQTL